MKQFKISITQQFFLFLILVSLIPIVLVSTLFYQEIESKFNDRVNNLLSLGALVTDDSVRNDLETLLVSTKQAAAFSVYQTIYQYLETRNQKFSEEALQRFQQLRRLERVIVFDAQGKVIYQSGPPINPEIERQVQMGFKSKAITSIEKEDNGPNQGASLSYVGIAPIIDQKSASKKVLGVLLTSYPMKGHFSLQDMLKIFPHLDIRVVVQSPNGPQVLSSSSTVLTAIRNRSAFQQLNDIKFINSGRSIKTFTEVFNHETFRSLAFPLQNFQKKNIGYMVISSSESDFSELKNKNILYVTGYLIFAGLLILIATYIFRGSVIKPIDELAVASEAVLKGDLSLRVYDQQRHEKIHNMMSNFNKMLAQLEEDNLLKTTFVSTLTHDLRTPLFAQKRVLEAIEKNRQNYDPDLLAMVQTIQQGNQQLLDMVNKILEAYQYEAGRISIFQETLNLHQLVESCFIELSPLAQVKQITLVNNTPAELLVYADAEQLKRVFQNLISNAIANIQAQREVKVLAQSYGLFTQIEVRDNGPGISLDLQKQLFQRYFTGHTKQKIGSGLGLFICRMILELHGGSIKVSSELGQGTVFTLILPNQPERENSNV